MFSSSHGTLVRRAAQLIVALSACEQSSVQCILPPCVSPMAIEATVSTGNAHLTVPGAFIVSSTSGNQPVLCSQDAVTICRVPGTAGEYDIDIGAPGFQTAHRHVVVTGRAQQCGCPIVDLQQIAVVLDPVA